MLHPTTPDDLRRRRLLVAGAATALLLIAFITYAVLVHRANPLSPARIEPKANSDATATVETTPVAVRLPALRRTDDPEQYAREVAQAIFEWDTATMISRDDHFEQLIKVGDPTGESAPGLLSDLENYLPTTDSWVDLAQYETRQWLTIATIATPSKWAGAEAQAGSELLPGTTAFTIHGVRHRSGIWENEPVTSAHDVAFTVFIVCGPSYPDCHLLRLSILDQPLD